MIHKIKFGVNRFIYDSESGYLHPLDELGFKMLDYLELPMAKECPSALRYDLAKYDSDSISAVYAELRKLSDEGKLFLQNRYIAPEDSRGKAAAKVTDTASGVRIEAVIDGENEAVAEVEELSREVKLSLKARKGSIFAPVNVREHGFEQCSECHARHLCSLEAPGRKVCEYERLRLDCELAARALGQKNSL